MTARLLILFILVFSSLGAVAELTLKDEITALLKSSEQGDAEAQYNLATRYYWGEGG